MGAHFVSTPSGRRETGDVRRLEHLDGWKTLIPCEHSAEAVVSYLRSSRPVYLARLDISVTRVAA